jgi:outer membrane scaffolding protein for murein synthesis (MipA/OmpV family)
MELNAFGEFFIDEWSIIGRVGQDVSEDGGGFVADLGIRWASQVSETVRVEVGSGLSWASASYLDRFFGVGPRESASSGLRLYDATPGLKDVSISGSVSYSLTDNWTIGGLVGAQRLLGPAASSPVVKDENEFFGGLSLDYRF